VLVSAAAVLGGFLSGLVARIAKSWPNRQVTSVDLAGRSGQGVRF
jgi:hypothetical protein